MPVKRPMVDHISLSNDGLWEEIVQIAEFENYPGLIDHLPIDMPDEFGAFSTEIVLVDEDGFAYTKRGHA